MSHLDWHVGMKVVCVGCEGTPKPPGFWEQWEKGWGIVKPHRNEVYTIREMRISPAGRLHLRLVEVINPSIEFTDAPRQEPWWDAAAFRPVQTRKTDISVFTAMLTGSKERSPA